MIVPDHQLSLAIGREGQNARLAARLTGVRIDIRSETQLAEGIPARRDELEPGVEYAEGQWVANAETGEMEWHAADGSVISEAEWNAAGGERRRTATRRRGGEAGEPPTTDAAPTATRPPSADDAPATWRGGRRAAPTRPRPTRPATTSRRATARQSTTPVDPTSLPERTCVGCRRRDRRRRWCAACSRPTVEPPSTAPGPGAGRGCAPRRGECFELAVRRRAFERAWRRPVGPDALAGLASRARACQVTTRKVE